MGFRPLSGQCFEIAGDAGFEQWQNVMVSVPFRGNVLKFRQPVQHIDVFLRGFRPLSGQCFEIAGTTLDL